LALFTANVKDAQETRKERTFMLEIGEDLSWRKRGREANSRQKAPSVASFLPRVYVAAMGKECRWKEVSAIGILEWSRSNQAATLHFMSASRISPHVCAVSAIDIVCDEEHSLVKEVIVPPDRASFADVRAL
jgi:hypothetical protein